jgi:Fe-S oxidoreductase
MNDILMPMIEVAELIEQTGGDTLRMCYQCGTCTASCPHGELTSYRVRDVIRKAQLGLEGYEGDDLWRCSTCGLCVDRCPREVEITEVFGATREIMHEMGTVPGSIRGMLSSVRGGGNPWGGEAAERHAWAGERTLPAWSEGLEILLFQCCTTGYDPRAGKVGLAMLRLLDAAGVQWGLLPGEQCCGESVRKVGDRALFESLRDANREAIVASGATRVVTTSPHTLDTFRRDYDLPASIEVVHLVTFLRELIDAGRLVPSVPVERIVTYHDPCYLGRWQGVYDDPRAVLRAIPGLELVEMASAREDSLCCGGGGGGMWIERPPQERLAVVRWREADDVGASTVATACPYCTLMLEDGRTALGRDEGFAVLDVVELLAASLA